MLIDPQGESKSALQIILEEAAGAGVEEFAIVVCPGDEAAYAAASGALRDRVRFVAQQRSPRLRPRRPVRPRVHRRRDLPAPRGGPPARRHRRGQLRAGSSSAWPSPRTRPVSAVQPTHEGLLTAYGTVGGRLVGGERPLYQIETVIEKPTPTVAEQQLLVPGLRAGYYLCFFGMHVLPPEIFGLLEEQGKAAGQVPRALPRPARPRLAPPLPGVQRRRAGATTSAPPTAFFSPSLRSRWPAATGTAS